jgi:hypothetical protein
VIRVTANAKVVLAMLFIAGLLAHAQTDAAKTVRSSDPAVASILEFLSHPNSAHVQANDIRVAVGEYTHCETHGSSTDCTPRTNFESEYQLVLAFNFNGQPIKVVGGCSPSESRHCQGFSWLGGTRPDCRFTSKAVYVCTNEGSSNTFLIEKKKWKTIHEYFIYPVEGGKPNRRYYIPLAAINDMVVSSD